MQKVQQSEAGTVFFQRPETLFAGSRGENRKDNWALGICFIFVVLLLV